MFQSFDFVDSAESTKSKISEILRRNVNMINQFLLKNNKLKIHFENHPNESNLNFKEFIENEECVAITTDFFSFIYLTYENELVSLLLINYLPKYKFLVIDNTCTSKNFRRKGYSTLLRVPLIFTALDNDEDIKAIVSSSVHARYDTSLKLPMSSYLMMKKLDFTRFIFNPLNNKKDYQISDEYYDSNPEEKKKKSDSLKKNMDNLTGFLRGNSLSSKNKYNLILFTNEIENSKIINNTLNDLINKFT